MGEIRITNVKDKVKQDLENIAENSGVKLTPFLKVKLKELADSYPDDMKRKAKN